MHIQHSMTKVNEPTKPDLSRLVANNLRQITTLARAKDAPTDAALIAIFKNNRYQLVGTDHAAAVRVAGELNDQAQAEFAQFVLIARLSGGIPMLCILSDVEDKPLEVGYSVIEPVR